MSEFTKRLENITTKKNMFEYGFADLDTPGYLNLTACVPGAETLKDCCDMFEMATQERMKEEKQDLSMSFQYGGMLGRLDYRTELAQFLTNRYRSQVDKLDLVLTCGTMQGICMVLQSLVDTSGVCFIDEVTYITMLKIIEKFPLLTVVTVPITEFGVHIAKFEELIHKHKPIETNRENKKMFWGFHYTIPIYHNPTGIVFTPANCKSIVELSRTYNFLTISDDIYTLLSYGPVQPRRLFAYDDMHDEDYKGNVISTATFSKILSPGVQVGWMEFPPRCIRALLKSGILHSSGGGNNYTFGIITTLLETGMVDKNLDKSVRIYKERITKICDILKNHLPNTCEFHAPTGGLVIWIKLPKHINSTAFNKYCKEKYKVCGITGDIFSYENKFKNHIRIAISFYELPILVEGTHLFCKAFRQFERAHPSLISA